MSTKLRQFGQLDGTVVSPLEETKSGVELGLFLAEVQDVDEELGTVVIQDRFSGNIYTDVLSVPVTMSSDVSTDMTLPTKGSLCIVAPLLSSVGARKLVVICYQGSDSFTGLHAVARRSLPGVPEHSARRRGVFRKVYQGQRSVTLSEGFSARYGRSWDRSSADMSRERLDTFSRVLRQSFGGTKRWDESGDTRSGQINRPGSELSQIVQPDGVVSQIYTLSEKSPVDRYKSGEEHTVPLTERLTRTMEFGLDFPVPDEILDEVILDNIVGVTAKNFSKTNLLESNGATVDDRCVNIEQGSDNPEDLDVSKKVIGPFSKDGITFQRKGFIHEKVVGNHVGYNRFDNTTYGKLLKPVLFPLDKRGFLGSSVESGYVPITKTPDYVESILAASAYSSRFPYDYNTTRVDITKEGLVQFEIGATLPKENITIGGGTYEHPYGAGVSLVGHVVGSTKLVLGKNRDMEESLDLTTLGQVVMRLGCDDSVVPSTRRDVLTQIRSMSDVVGPRTIQYWTKEKKKLAPGNSPSLEQKTGAESVSLRMATDGGVVARLGARHINSKRKHLINGFKDGQGVIPYSIEDPNRKDSRTQGRPTYNEGDEEYAFHDLTMVGNTGPGFPPYQYSGSPIPNPDKAGQSLDLHLVRDALLRFGKNDDNGQSLTLDLGGGMVLAIGKDKKGRSITAQLDGGTEISIGSNDKGSALQLDIKGNVNMSVEGHYVTHVTGSYVLDVNEDFLINCHGRIINVGLQHINASASNIINQALDVVNNQGQYSDDFPGGDSLK